MVSGLDAFDGLHRMFERLMIEGSLTLGQQGQLVLLNLVGQVADNGLVRLQAAQQERSRNSSETVGHLLITFSLYRIGELLFKSLCRAKIALVGEVHDAPKLRKAVLDGCAAHGDVEFGGDGAQGLALSRISILNVLGLVDDDGKPREFLQFGDIRAQHAVCGQENISIFKFFEITL